MNPHFLMTFGIRYSTECHPSNRIVHPKGYVTLVAESRDAALFMAHEIFDGHFAEVREEWEVNTANYPLGEIARYVQGEPYTEPDAVITDNGMLLVRGMPRVFTPGEATALANLIADQAVQAVSITAEKAAARARLAEAGVKKHDDMF